MYNIEDIWLNVFSACFTQHFSMALILLLYLWLEFMKTRNWCFETLS